MKNLLNRFTKSTYALGAFALSLILVGALFQMWPERLAAQGIGVPYLVVSSGSGGWSNAQVPITAAIGTAASGIQTNVTQIAVPANAKNVCLEFKGYLGAASSTATNVVVGLGRSVTAVGNANGVYATAASGMTNQEFFTTWLVPVASGAAQCFAITNLNVPVASVGNPPYWYIDFIGMGFNQATSFLTNYTTKVSFSY